MAYDNAGVPRQDLDTSINTDWQDVAFQTGSIQDYNMTFSGGGSSGSYLVSANYFDNKGTVISTDFKRLSLRVNTQSTKGKFTIGENIAVSNSKADEMSGNPFYDVVRLLPTIPVRDPNNPGGYGYGNESKARTFGTNPVAIADLEDRTNENLRVRGNLWSELAILPSLKYRINLGYETSADHYTYFRKEGNWTLNQAYDPSIGNENRARYVSTLVENTLTFDKTFDKHNVNVLAGYTYQNENYAQIWATRRNFVMTSDGAYYQVLDAGVTDPEAGGFRNEAILLSYLGRVNYDYNAKYYLSAVIRRDGTSRVSKANRWGNFPSFAAAWRISNESFFNVPWMNDLKVRANYGTLGSSNIGFYDYLPVVNTFATAVFGRDQHYESGATQVKLVNQDLKWETLTQQNYGFDATLLNNRISLTAEYFIAETKDVLVGMPIAMTTGNDGGNPVANAATLLNKGFELSATYRNEKNPFKYFATVNFTRLRNEVVSLGYGREVFYTWMTKTQIGDPIAMFYLLKTNGLFRSQQEVDSYVNSEGIVIQPNAKPGDIRFIDYNDDGKITGDDRMVIGSPWPDFEVGLNAGASWKGFDFSMTWFSAVGAKVFNGPRSVMDRFDDNSNYRKGVRPWTPENPDTDFPRAYYGSTLNSRGDSDRWIEDGTFTRLKFISLGYTLPSDIVKKAGFESCKVSVSGQNLITFSKYMGLDPEFTGPNIFEKGHEAGAFPNTRTVSFGLQLSF